jgi:hypothetical protein
MDAAHGEARILSRVQSPEATAVAALDRGATAARKHSTNDEKVTCKDAV